MDTQRVHTALPDPPSEDAEGNKEEEKAFQNIFADLESVDLPLGTTLRYKSKSKLALILHPQLMNS